MLERFSGPLTIHGYDLSRSVKKEVGLPLPAAMNNAEFSEFLQRASNTEWTDGNPNLDNDVHIGWFYLLSSSMMRPPLGDPRFAYRTVLSRFHNFDETYYVPLPEAVKVGENITQQMIADPQWMPGILDHVHHACDDLDSLGRKSARIELESLTNDKLKQLYDWHTSLHLNVYDTARIPEALDRGDNYFTNFLRRYLDQKLYQTSVTMRWDSVNELFSQLVAPIRSSELENADIDLMKIAIAIQTDPDGSEQRDLFKNSRKKKDLWLYLKPNYKKMLNGYHDEYGSLEYHGYGSRSLSQKGEFLDMLTEYVNGDPQNDLEERGQRLKDNKSRKERLFEELRIDPAFQHIFRVYPEIGITKMYRRHRQLANFHFLDRVIEEVATRFELTEAEVRACIPLEISALLDDKNPAEKRSVYKRIKERSVRDFTYVIDGKEHFIIDDAEKSAVLHSVIEETIVKDEPTLSGLTIVPGIVDGVALYAIRPEDIDDADIPPGTSLIIVSGSTDPDLMRKIADVQRKGNINIEAILTQTGGVTCHAAITATEIQIPTIVGIRNLLHHVGTGDRLSVNADSGFVDIVEKHETESSALPSFPSTLSLQGAKVEDIGYKAFNLAKLHRYSKSGGFDVPAAFFMPQDFVLTEIDKAKRYEHAKDYQISDELKEHVIANSFAMKFDPRSNLVIRSSTTYEDSGETAAAGYYDTILNIKEEDVIDELEKYIFINSRMDPNRVAYSGGIIIQEMIWPDFSGVMFSKDPNPGNPDGSNHIIVEAIAGHNAKVTSGQITPSLFVIERNAAFSGGIKQIDHRGYEENAKNLGGLLDAGVIKNLAMSALKVEQYFKESFKNKPADIEWAYAQGQLYILQARSLVAFN